ncbi:unnamed protein product [Cuscuta epithymum]|uniref:Uncharacterized protein n=1 Tax=Cuscuta epithymum TaxID=186058 RepID=A0AAV0G6Q5_9ASTE|nr:unnamed protein product [Cuscuta epithymum]CAH9143623.1 unnamed protein product [Cuscuta epithymum]
MSIVKVPGSPNHELEEEVKQMAAKLADLRATVLDQLKATRASLLAANEPVQDMHFDFGSRHLPGPSRLPGSDLVAVGSNEGPSTGEEQDEAVEQTQLLKQKYLRNAELASNLLKRLKEVMEFMGRIDKLGSQRPVIHPAFKRKRSS